MKTTWWNRLKCAMGWHSWFGLEVDDMKGNRGIIVCCEHCPEVEII